MSSHPDTERLRQLFSDAADDITPSPVPLSAIEKAGQARRRRRRTAVLAAGCGLLLVPLAATTMHVTTPTPTPTTPTPSPKLTARPAAPPSTVRVVAPGERVQAAPKVELWLTKEGKHWSTPNQADQFRSIVDGNVDTSRPGVSLQMEPVDGRYFLSGLYHGKGNAAAVKLATDKGTITGHVVRLAGQLDWGTWYALSPLPDESETNDPSHNFVSSITVLDAEGRTIATLALS
ncbi:hypothetical protein E0500_011135 [Streptomyces sp. KM273126]|uniref:hypothetical protein n=1 Tax=Streptomyces sp. KM273126 TaxID=2545247 RepID=UPI00103E4A77|nr:hypothetical protein [Streptomyces sp. KM273126]MBA2807949.1 hypothetical protein [Streptomyces sp. KM273126]